MNQSKHQRRKLLNVIEAAELLGISINTIYGWAYQKKITYHKIGRLLKFYEDDLLAWIEERKVVAAEF